MNFYFVRLLKELFVCSLFLFLVSCGGGGGGESATLENNSSPYSGLTTQVKIGSDNAVQLSTEVFMGGGTLGSDLSLTSAVTLNSRNYLTPVIDLSRVLSKTFEGYIITPDNEYPSAASAESSNPDVEEGKFGGTLTRTITIDESTNTATGSFVYSNYCPSETEWYNGKITFTGKYDPDTEKLNLDCVFNNYSQGEDGYSTTLMGTASVEITTSKLSMTLNTYIRNDDSHKVYWFNDMTLSITDTGTSEELTLEGRFYNPDRGYVDFSTVTPFACDYSEDYPHCGILQLTGNQGTQAQLIVDSNSSFHVVVETDGDGDFDDWGSGALSW